MFYQKVLSPLLALLFFTSAFKAFSQQSESVNRATYTLTDKATTSAGVYKADGTLVRTLWSGVVKDAGVYEVNWDGTDDFKSPLPVDDYKIKVVSNNVQYTWQGTIGNSSANQVGPNIHRSLDPPNNIVIAADNAYYTVGYDEMTPSHFQFALKAPQVKLDPFAGIGNQTTDYACTDGTNVYWTGWDNYQNAYSWVYATKVSDNSLVNFPHGVHYKVKYGKEFPSVIDFKSVQAKPSGIAVSKEYLFVSYKALSYVTVLNKSTGAVVRNINFNAPTAMAVDGNDIWICEGTSSLNKYSIRSDGTLGNAHLSISNLSSPVDVRVNGNMLAVVDGGVSQQVKTFNISSGAPIWTLGQQGGLLNSPVVSNDRFGFWKINEETSIKINYGGIAFASDGSFWVCDPANRRMQHYDANRNFIESVQYQSKTYTCFVDPNNHARVLANLLEFQVDYSSPIKKAWTLKYNWEGNFKEGYNLQSAIRDITTLSNGRTYGLVSISGHHEVVELLASSGIRYTGVILDEATKMYPDGSVYNISGTAINETQTWKKRTLVGFNGNNPVFSANNLILKNSVTDMKQPRLSGFRINPWEITSSNVLVNFRGNREQPHEEDAYHLGGMNPTTGQWIWKTSIGTHRSYNGEFPADGAFDIGNGTEYSANVAMAIERSIIWGFNGEGWKGSQTNKWNHFYDNGLFVGQFGYTGPEFNEDPITAAGFAGNAFSPALIKEGNEYYMYHNDESVHGGIHRWKITGLNSIHEQTIPITTSFIRNTEEVAGIDLMAGLPYLSVLGSHASGWTRSPGDESDRWSAKTNLLTYGKGKSPDLYVVYNASSNGINTINRELGHNNNLSGWKITGKVGYNTSEPNSPDGKGLNQYLDVLDNSGKIIVRFYQQVNYSRGVTGIYANKSPLFQKGVVEMKAMTKSFQPLEINKVGGAITVTYTGQSTTVKEPYESGADMSSPTTMRLYFSNVSGTLFAKSIRISEFRFISSNSSSSPSTPTVTADNAVKTLTASHAFGNSEILVSENDGNFLPYKDQINVGNVARPEGYWKFKIRATAQRIESAVVSSPAFVETYETQCSATGTIMHEVWYNVNGLNLSNNNWSKKPDNTSPVKLFEAPSNIGENFAARIRGYICPPQTGTYTFWISGDDATELWMSTDADPANKSKIAYNNSYTTPRDWNLHGSQKSFEIHLKAGNKYYIEALHKEASGQDHFAVAWQMPDGEMEAPIAGSRLSPFDSNAEAAPVADAKCSATGSISHEIWHNVKGSGISSNNWSKKPDNTNSVTTFEAPSNIGENYASRIRGYICPPETGNYTFWISGDDATELWLSTDANPANKSKIAYSTSYTPFRDWNLHGSQKSFQIYLKAGTKYYIEAMHKEEYGQDYFTVAWQLPNGNMEAPIAGSHLSPFGDNSNVIDETPTRVAECSATGGILHEVWQNVRGSRVSSNNWSKKPDYRNTVNTFEAPTELGENFASRIRGFICPPQTGNYTFWISGDDATELWLSTDADPENKSKIAYNTSYTYPRDWNLHSTQKSVQIYLKAGSKYYVEALHKEEYGQDHVSVAWQLPDGSTEAPISGSHLSPYEYEDDNESGKFEQADARIVNAQTTLSELGAETVQLTAMKAAQVNQEVFVEFTSTDKSNQNKYDVEKSQDGRTFKITGEVNAIKNANSSGYTFVDKNPFPGDNYYRIKSVSKSGAVVLSNVALAKYINFEESIRVYPNPIINNNIFIESASLPTGIYAVTLVNSLGETIYRKLIHHTGGLLNHRISLSVGLPKGIYLLHISGKEKAFTRKLIK